MNLNLILTIALGVLGVIASTSLKKSKVSFEIKEINIFKLLIALSIVALTIICAKMNQSIESENAELQRKLLERTSQTERVIFQEYIELFKNNQHTFEMKIPSLSEVEITGFDAELLILFGYNEFDIPNTKDKTYKIKVPPRAIGEKFGETMWNWSILHKYDNFHSGGTIKILSTIDIDN